MTYNPVVSMMSYNHVISICHITILSVGCHITMSPVWCSLTAHSNYFKYIHQYTSIRTHSLILIFSVHIWEFGCSRDFYCEGGAVCVDKRCACPTGYKSVARNTKCAKIGGRCYNRVNRSILLSDDSMLSLK